MQQQIDYSDILAAGFVEEFCEDPVFFGQYGYPYSVITKQLSKRVYLDWEKNTRLCYMLRTDKDECITGRMPIKDLQHLREILNFYCK